MAYNKHHGLHGVAHQPMGQTLKESSEPKPRGRPPLPDDLKRTARLSMRTYPEIAEKAARLGTEGVEKAIKRAREPINSTTIKESA